MHPGMYEGPEEEVGEGTELPRTPSEELRGKLNWMTLERSREMSWMVLVQRCVMKNAPQCLNKRLKTNAEIGRWVTRGHDHQKLYVPRANTEWYHKSFTFRGIQEWNSLPRRSLGP